MNNKYFKRQLVLHDLGVDVDIYYYYNIFLEKIDGMEEFTDSRFKESIFYKKGDYIFLECHSGDLFFICSDLLDSFSYKFNLNIIETESIIKCCLEHFFKVKIYELFPDDFCEFDKY